MQEEQKIIVNRVPATLADEVARAAQRELLSVSSYVRRLLLTCTGRGGHGVSRLSHVDRT
jgi:hypothetical protein